jgi:alkylhydroperoxidase family enzyme
MMNAFIPPPQKIPFYIRLGLWWAKRTTGKEMLIGKLLAWYPRAAISSGILESLIAHDEPDINERILKLVRMQASFAVQCPFCVDMNSYAYAEQGITADEIAAMRGQIDPGLVNTFSERERLALEYTKCVSQTPLKFMPTLIDQLKQHFSEREIVIIATTAAQVNYWARLIQALGVPPVGYSKDPSGF